MITGLKLGRVKSHSSSFVSTRDASGSCEQEGVLNAWLGLAGALPFLHHIVPPCYFFFSNGGFQIFESVQKGGGQTGKDKESSAGPQ